MREAIVHGMILAFGLILPLGVQNIFVFNQGALHSRFRSVLPVVVTAALCDTLLIAAAVGGVSLLLLTLDWLTPAVYGAGVLFLLYMGWQIWSAAPASGEVKQLSTRGQVGYALSVSLLNPHALLDTVGVIGTGSLGYEGAERWGFAAATAAVSWLWFLGLAAAGRTLGRIDTSGKVIRLLNRGSALLIWVMAVYMGLQLWRSFQA
ncbi:MULTISPECIES: LysE/ArgO family amino acid transporter [unclassified Paenibacillus]|uniref:LysE/ArgO family amino acid transporter n=1 Tax=unclassified Paenibacillus TaxID=185978 RepID=UPI0024057B7E|nr:MULTISPECIES: LysE/ArgO family amino acid transporter [unclassified Paenibacillus]MDF9840065.1 L-lysine exporter family protein LysE/ArgO [Paenibacillus sp. PastF-2]MDF9846647.1 L-lysine exporter family protein LysE/ArgO [Paenibacillus sp. PastM-2]MDF9853005.1 L-lysine exporter family protein LysE/ArgO [Paenibacillus sp. PastF-1]MDH6478491.1 L-lysine exporter family protein LysE/ArgO [Paenibacillus sp. PastH-2]MDH6506011.1 L-lysine exporter family protein LysE/ArgO [Paenibacillus sp. PastM-